MKASALLSAIKACALLATGAAQESAERMMRPLPQIAGVPVIVRRLLGRSGGICMACLRCSERLAAHSDSIGSEAADHRSSPQSWLSFCWRMLEAPYFDVAVRAGLLP